MIEEKIVLDLEHIVLDQLKTMEENNISTKAFIIQIDLSRGRLEILSKPIPIIKYVIQNEMMVG